MGFVVYLDLDEEGLKDFLLEDFAFTESPENQGDPPQIWDRLCPICWGFYEVYYFFHLYEQHLMLCLFYMYMNRIYYYDFVSIFPNGSFSFSRLYLFAIQRTILQMYLAISPRGPNIYYFDFFFFFCENQGFVGFFFEPNPWLKGIPQ